MNRWFLLCALTVVPASLLAQPINVFFEHLSVKNGLPGSSVYSITKDRQGFMWFGTRRCPTRYDGASFRSFLFPETYLITGLAADSANRMWVASDRRGICRIDPNGVRLTPVPNTPQTTGYVYIDRHGEGWFSYNDGVGRINLRTGKVRLFPFPAIGTFFGLKAYGFLEDRTGTLWAIGSVNGLFRFDRKTQQFTCVLGLNCTNPQRRRPLFLSRGCVGRDGFLWIGSYEGGLIRYDPQTNEFKSFKSPDPANDVTCVEEGVDEAGRRILWVGDTQGLLVFRPEQGRFFRQGGLLPEPFTTQCLYRDPVSGIVWAGTSDGVLKYNPQDNRIRTVTLPPSSVRQPVTVKVVQADQRDTSGQSFWLGLSHTGFLHWHRPTNQFQLVRFPDAGSECTWFDQTHDGRLWVGIRRLGRVGDGVLVYDPAERGYIANPAAQRVTKLFGYPYADRGFVDHQQRLWVGNFYRGVRVMNSQTGQLLHPWPDSVSDKLHQNNFLTDLQLDATGRAWVGTYQGLYAVVKGPPWFKNVDAPNPNRRQPEDPAINSLLVARNGHVWAARWGSVTESGPDGKLLTVLTARDGLFDRENRQVAEDQNGTIWVGNFEGLHAYNPRTRKLWRLTVSDGLSHNNTMNALYVHRSTELFVGQVNGLNYFDVRQITQPKPDMPVVVSSFRVHERERSIDPAQPIQLARSDNAFSVDFLNLTYSRLPNTQYAYRLDGLEENWHYSGTAHRAYYTNLGPGTYTLNLKAADSFGRWGGRPVQLSITVLPAYYETWWFRLLVGLSIIGVLYGLYRYRVNQLLRVQRIRNRISADLHDEIGSSLSSISILGAMANQTLPSGHPSGSMVERIVSEARQVSGSLDDIVWSINPHNDALSNLIARMNRYAAELFEASGIHYTIHIPDDIRQLKLPMEKRQDFYLIFKEAVNNLVKHAQATEATIRIHVDNRQLHLLISDNGVGFDPMKATDRSGLRNMHARAQKLQGKLTIQATPKNGTTLKLDFPVG